MNVEELATNYSRQSPSAKYLELLQLYQFLHENGEIDRNKPPEKTFQGSSAPAQAVRIKRLVELFSAESILDYGAGKGQQYDIDIQVEGLVYRGLHSYWGVTDLYRYDPAYKPFNRLPDKQFDGVICTDVLEHIPETDVVWVLDEIFSYARKFVFANIACYPAKKTLPNGDNAHCTIYSQEWWAPIFQRLHNNFPLVKFEVWLHSLRDTPEGLKKTDFKMTNI